MLAASAHLTPVVALLVISAGVLHAVWNLIAKVIEDRLLAFALIGLAMGLGGAVMLAVGGFPTRAALGLCLISASIHTAYQFGLIASYNLGAFNQVYPLARGTAPLVVALVAYLLLGESLPAVGLVGILVLTLGLVGLAFSSGTANPEELPAIVAAVLTGLAIALYTSIDGVAVRRSGTVLGYTGLLFLIQGPFFPIAVLLRRPLGVWRHVETATKGLLAGAIGLFGYTMVLFAQTKAPLALVAALRESAVISGAILGWVVLHERFGARRVAAAATVAAGIGLVAIS